MSQNIQQREELHKTIWAIANSLRGAIDGWEFKSYVLCSIFYRFISENMQQYIDHLQELAGVKDFDYSKLDDSIAETVRTQMVQEKGYFILPSQLFCNVCKTCRQNENLNLSLQYIFRAIEASAQGTPSEDDVRGLFSDFAVNNSQLGQSVQIRNQKLADVLLAVRDMNLHTSRFEDNEIDTFGDTYEFLMKMYASNAGKSGGEFYTPQEVSELLAELASINNEHIDSVYDPACGSGSLLMKFKKIIGKDNPDLKYYGQEINPTTYNLCRINMFLHNINFSNFDIKLGDTLLKPMHKGMKFDAIVSNPPYSLPWIGKENPLLINDERYAPASVLAPKSKSDLAFTMHMLYHLKERGTCAIVEFPGVLYRGNDEQKIRQYLVSNNYVDTIIQLPENLFFGVGIATCILVLKKSAKRDSSILFIDASKLYDKVGNKNVLSKQHSDRIIELFKQRKDVDHLSKLVPNDKVLENKSNLTVSYYVDPEDSHTAIDIMAVNEQLNTEIVPDCETLRLQINNNIVNNVASEHGSISKLIQQLCPKGVPYKTLGELGIFESTGVDKKKVLGEKEITLLNYMDVYKHKYIDLSVPSMVVTASDRKIEQCNVLKDDIFITPSSETRNDIGHAAVIMEDMPNVVYSYHIMRFRLNEPNTITAKYIRYLFDAPILQQQIRKSAMGLTRFGLSKGQFAALVIPVPPVEVQREIVEKIDTIDSYIRKLDEERDLRQQQYEYYREHLINLLK